MEKGKTLTDNRRSIDCQTKTNSNESRRRPILKDPFVQFPSIPIQFAPNPIENSYLYRSNRLGV